MKSFRRILFSLMITVFCISCVFGLAACKKTVTLKFETNGGTAIESITGEPGSTITPPQDPVLDGFKFDGWYLKSDFSGERTDIPSKMPDKDTTYYAKWAASEKYQLTLDAGTGGTLAQTTYMVAEGTNLSSFLADKIPNPNSGLEFGAWYNWNKQVGANDVMPNSELELTARYLSSYTVNIYKQDKEGNYPQTPETETGKSYYEDKFIFNKTIDHFTIEKDHEGSNLQTNSLGINDTFVVYYKRDNYRISFNGNPALVTDGTVTGSMEPLNALYEEEIDVPECDFKAQHSYYNNLFRFSGWATSENGEVVYRPGEKFQAEQTLTLYAVWNRGYLDLFGGNDVLFTEGENAIIIREGEEATGTYDATTASFSCRDGELQGKVNIAFGGFSYTNAAEAGKYTGFSTYKTEKSDNGELRPELSLDLDDAGNAKFTASEGDESITIDGFYHLYTNISNQKLYYFRSNTLNFGFYLTEYTPEGGSEPQKVFVQQGEEAGQYTEFTPLNVQGYGATGNNILTLDGFGTVIMTNSNTGAYTYGGIYYPKDISDDGITLSWRIERYEITTNAPADSFTFVLTSAASQIYIVHDDKYGIDEEYKRANDGKGTLKLDGYSALNNSATYTDENGIQHIGKYFVTESKTAGARVDFNEIDTSGNIVKSYQFTLDLTAKTFDIKDEYTEYRYLKSNIGDPIIVLYETPYSGNSAPEGAKKAEIWQTEDGPSKCLIEGYYTVKNSENNIYEFVGVNDKSNGEYTDWKSVIFKTSIVTQSGLYSYDIYYIYKLGNNKLYEEYTGAGTEKLYVQSEVTVSGMGSFYVDSSNVLREGSVTRYEDFGHFKQDIFEFVSGGSSYYFEYNSAEKTFSLLTVSFPAAMRWEDQHRNIDEEESLFIDGKGKAVYIKDDQEIEGTYAETGITSKGSAEYTFTSDTETFKFIMYTDTIRGESVYVYLTYSETFDKEIATELGTLTIDGYAYLASLMMSSSTTVYIDGQYYISDDDKTIIFISTYGIFYFDVTDESTFTNRGNEYGDYIFVDNYVYQSKHVLFDGYGKVTLYDGTKIIANGTYEFIDEEYYEFKLDLTYVEGSRKEPLEVSLITIENQMVCMVKQPDVGKLFVNDDWTMLSLDGYGTAVYVNGDGYRYSGPYMLISDNLLFFNSDTYKAMVNYDAENAKFTFIDNSAYYGAYYAEDLSSVVLDVTATVNGETAYYTVGEDGKTVNLYMIDSSNAPYFYKVKGEVTIEDNKVTYGGKDYHKFTDQSITLTGKYHEPEDSTLYNVTIEFTPTGESSFGRYTTMSGYQDEIGILFYVQYVREGEAYNLNTFIYDGTYQHNINVKLTTFGSDGWSGTFHITRTLSSTTYYDYRYLSTADSSYSGGVMTVNRYWDYNDSDTLQGNYKDVVSGTLPAAYLDLESDFTYTDVEYTESEELDDEKTYMFKVEIDEETYEIYFKLHFEESLNIRYYSIEKIDTAKA